MRLLIDENLSKRLPMLLADLLPGSTHVDLIGLHGASDEAIWEVARQGGYAIVSKDTDFYQRSVTMARHRKSSGSE